MPHSQPPDLDGPAIRHVHGDDSRESIRRKKKLVFIRYKRFMRIGSNLQFAFLSALRGSQEGVQFGNLLSDSRESGDPRESVNRFA